jgi:alpha-ketoglutarate-dependent taurine dioxygenase
VIPREAIDPERAWTGSTLSPGDYLLPFPDACAKELDAAIATGPDPAGPVTSLSPDAFPLDACRRLMARVRTALARGPGHVIVDGIPVERYRPAQAQAVAWLLARLLGQVVAQTWGGTFLYDVKDSGKALGYGVRRSVTNLGQPFHTDGGWLTFAPGFVGLLCLQPGQQGGLSRVTSLLTAHNTMRRRHPRLLPRLYRPFFWDRQAEHPPEAPRAASHPLFAVDGGTLAARYYDDYVVKGHELAGQPLDQEGVEALAALREIVDTPEHWVEFRLERGQLQYVNNRQVAHCRTAFVDAPGPASHRHLIRIWNRDEGAPDLEGRGLA